MINKETHVDSLLFMFGKENNLLACLSISFVHDIISVIVHHLLLQSSHDDNASVKCLRNLYPNVKKMQNTLNRPTNPWWDFKCLKIGLLIGNAGALGCALEESVGGGCRCLVRQEGERKWRGLVCSGGVIMAVEVCSIQRNYAFLLSSLMMDHRQPKTQGNSLG